MLGVTLVCGFLAVSSGATAATPPTVDHPTEQCIGTFIESQPPGSGFTVTVAYTGNMWIKAGPVHFAVPAVTKGEVYTPQNVSSWPMNEPGNAYLEISHVDYCVTEVPPTTEPPETTVPETTVPETTVPETTVPVRSVPETTFPKVPNECWIDSDPRNVIPKDGFVLYEPGNENIVGTHSISGIGCGPPATPADPVETTVTPTPTTGLATTGSTVWLLLAIGAAILALGAILARFSRR